MTASRGIHRKRQPFGCWVAVSHKTGCHEWFGSVGNHGYGRYCGNLVHRIAYEREKGPIPEGLSIDHLCRNRRCVNPNHLEAVTLAENSRREAKAREDNIRRDPLARMRAARCLRGHEKGGKTTCPVCAKASQAKHRDKLRAAFGSTIAPGGFGAHTNKRIEAQRAERAQKANRVAALYLRGVPTPKIAEIENLTSKKVVFFLLKVAGVPANRAKPNAGRAA